MSIAVEVPEIVERVHVTEDVVADQQIAKPKVRMRWTEGVEEGISQLAFSDRNGLRNKRAGARLVVDFCIDRHVQRVHWEDALATKPLESVWCW